MALQSCVLSMRHVLDDLEGDILQLRFRMAPTLLLHTVLLPSPWRTAV